MNTLNSGQLQAHDHFDEESEESDGRVVALYEGYVADIKEQGGSQAVLCNLEEALILARDAEHLRASRRQIHQAIVRSQDRQSLLGDIEEVLPPTTTFTRAATQISIRGYFHGCIGMMFVLIQGLCGCMAVCLFCYSFIDGTRLYSRNLQAANIDIIHCAEDYARNQCDDGAIPALREQCKAWNICRSLQPEYLVLKAPVYASAFWTFFCITALGTLMRLAYLRFMRPVVPQEADVIDASVHMEIQHTERHG